MKKYEVSRERGKKKSRGDALGVYLSGVERLWEVPLALALARRVAGHSLEHPVRLLREPHEPPAEVLQPGVGVGFWALVVLPGRLRSQCTGTIHPIRILIQTQTLKKGGGGWGCGDGPDVQGRICEWVNTEFAP